jgi:hypothetical protein
MDKYSALTMLCHAATPLLRVSDECIRQVAEAVSVSEPEPTAAPEPESPPASAGADDFRVLAAALAEEYGNLLTGVLGHTSLAMTEMGEGHSGLEDIRAIERSARGAARLTRRLSALCGSAHRGQAPLEVGPHMRTYVTRERADFFADGPAGLALPDAPCSVHMDGATLDIVLDGMADHARTALTAGPPVWSVSSHDGVVDFTLSYSGSPALPQGWLDHRLPLHSHAPLPELFFSREAARALGGDLEVRETDHGTDMVLTLPLMETRPAHEITPAPA